MEVDPLTLFICLFICLNIFVTLRETTLVWRDWKNDDDEEERGKKVICSFVSIVR